MSLADDIEKLSAEALPAPWRTPEETGDAYSAECPVDHEGCGVWPWGGAYGGGDSREKGEASMMLAYLLRNNVGQIVAALRSQDVFSDLDTPSDA